MTLRCWKTPDGNLLVEDAGAPGSRSYYVVRDGRIARSYADQDCSLDDSLFRLRYAVVDDRLELTMTEEMFCEERKRTASVELGGLIRMSDIPDDQLKTKIADRDESIRRMETVDATLAIAAREETPDAEGRRWAFYLLNLCDTTIDDVRLHRVVYEWGDNGSDRVVDKQLGPLAPQSYLRLWRDDDDAAELNLFFEITVTVAEETRGLSFELPKLYRRKSFVTLPLVGGEGVLDVVHRR